MSLRFRKLLCLGVLAAGLALPLTIVCDPYPYYGYRDVLVYEPCCYYDSYWSDWFWFP
jgi:hypothetical protein